MRKPCPMAFVDEVQAETITWFVPVRPKWIDTPAEMELAMQLGTVLGRMPFGPFSPKRAWDAYSVPAGPQPQPHSAAISRGVSGVAPP